MTCYDCRNRRRFARSAGVGLSSMWRICYPCWQRRRARWHVAGRIALVVFGAVTAIVVVLAAAGRLWR